MDPNNLPEAAFNPRLMTPQERAAMSEYLLALNALGDAEEQARLAAKQAELARQERARAAEKAAAAAAKLALAQPGSAPGAGGAAAEQHAGAPPSPEHAEKPVSGGQVQGREEDAAMANDDEVAPHGVLQDMATALQPVRHMQLPPPPPYNAVVPLLPLGQAVAVFAANMAAARGSGGGTLLSQAQANAQATAAAVAAGGDVIIVDGNDDPAAAVAPVGGSAAAAGSQTEEEVADAGAVVVDVPAAVPVQQAATVTAAVPFAFAAAGQAAAATAVVAKAVFKSPPAPSPTASAVSAIVRMGGAAAVHDMGHVNQGAGYMPPRLPLAPVYNGGMQLPEGSFDAAFAVKFGVAAVQPGGGGGHGRLGALPSPALAAAAQAPQPGGAANNINGHGAAAPAVAAGNGALLLVGPTPANKPFYDPLLDMRPALLVEAIGKDNLPAGIYVDTSTEGENQRYRIDLKISFKGKILHLFYSQKKTDLLRLCDALKARNEALRDDSVYQRYWTVRKGLNSALSGPPSKEARFTSAADAYLQLPGGAAPMAAVSAQAAGTAAAHAQAQALRPADQHGEAAPRPRRGLDGDPAEQPRAKRRQFRHVPYDLVDWRDVDGDSVFSEEESEEESSDEEFLPPPWQR